MSSDLANNHNRESQEFEHEFQKMVTATYDIRTEKMRDNIGAGQAVSAPQLPVLALKPDRLSLLHLSVYAGPPHLEGGLLLISQSQ